MNAACKSYSSVTFVNGTILTVMNSREEGGKASIFSYGA